MRTSCSSSSSNADSEDHLKREYEGFLLRNRAWKSGDWKSNFAKHGFGFFTIISPGHAQLGALPRGKTVCDLYFGLGGLSEGTNILFRGIECYSGIPGYCSFLPAFERKVLSFLMWCQEGAHKGHGTRSMASFLEVPPFALRRYYFQDNEPHPTGIPSSSGLRLVLQIPSRNEERSPSQRQCTIVSFLRKGGAFFYQGEDRRYNGVVQGSEMCNNADLRFRIAIGNGMVVRGDTSFRLVGEGTHCRFITWTLGVQGTLRNAAYSIPRVILPVGDGGALQYQLYDGRNSAYTGVLPVSYPLYSEGSVPTHIVQKEKEVEPMLRGVLEAARDTVLRTGGLIEDLTLITGGEDMFYDDASSSCSSQDTAGGSGVH